MIRFFKKYFVPIFLAFVIGGVTFFPQVVSVLRQSDKFQGVISSINDDDIYYLARARDVVDGHYFISNPYLFEYKNSSPMQFWLPDYLAAKPLAFFHIPVTVGYIFYDFLFLFILALLTYAIIFNLTKLSWYSGFGTVLIHLGLYLHDFNRSPSPQLIFIFWLLLLFCLLKYLKSEKKFYEIASTAIFGLLFYIYPYYWTFYLAFLGIFFCLYLLFEKKINTIFLFIAGGGLIIGLPYFFSVYKSAKLPYYKESLERLGMLNTHFPSGFKLVFLSVLVIFFFWLSYRYKKIKLEKIEIFLLSGVLTNIVCVNQHIVTGKNLEFSSHYQLIGEYWLILIIIFLISRWLFSNEKYRRAALAVFAVSIGVIAIFNTWQVVGRQIKFSEQEIYWQNYAPIFDWLNQNSAKESVVIANEDLSSLIPVYTSNNVYYSRLANLFFMPDREVKERFIINNYWQDFDKDFILQNERAIWGTQFINNYGHNSSKNKLRKLFLLPEQSYAKIPENQIQEFSNLAQEMRNRDFSELLKKYRVDYLVWDKNMNPEWGLDKYDFLKPSFNTNQFIIYRIDYGYGRI